MELAKYLILMWLVAAVACSRSTNRKTPLWHKHLNLGISAHQYHELILRSTVPSIFQVAISRLHILEEELEKQKCDSRRTVERRKQLEKGGKKRLKACTMTHIWLVPWEAWPRLLEHVDGVPVSCY